MSEHAPRFLLPPDQGWGKPLPEAGYPRTADTDSRRHPGSHPPHHGQFDAQSFWLWETLSFAAAAGLYGVYFYLLFKYDDQLVARWEEDNSSHLTNLFRTLPSAISFLTTLMRGAILLPVASAIGQLKWHYLRHERTAKAVELIDGASRGYWGAARLLASKSGLSFASVGSIITLGAIFLGPFLQNTVQQTQEVLRERSLDSPDNALLPVTNEIIVNGQINAQIGDEIVGSAMFSSIQAAWATGSRSVDIQRSELPYKCGHHHCEWTNVTTLSVRSRCRKADTRTGRYPNTGVEFGGSVEANIVNIGSDEKDMNGTTEGTILSRLVLKSNSTIPPRSGFIDQAADLPLILHLGALGYYNGTYHAAECVLYWAVVVYDGVMVNATGSYSTPVVEYNKTVSPIPVNTNITDPITIAGVNTCAFNQTVQSCNYTIQPYFHQGVRALLLPFLSGSSISYRLRIPDDPGEARSFDFNNPKIELFYMDWIGRIDSGKYEPEGSLAKEAEKFLDNMALYMTNNIRSYSKRFAVGAVGSLGPYFSIKKHYVVYPAVLLGASVVFVAATALWTRREPIWKNSALALLYHGFETIPGGGPELRTMAGMERASEGLLVRLSDTHDGLGLKLRKGDVSAIS